MQEALTLPNRKTVTREVWWAFWQRVVREQESSGFSLRHFCQQHGLSYSQSKHWRRVIKQKALQGCQQFIPITLEPTPMPGTTPGIELYYRQTCRLVIPLRDGWSDVLKQLLIVLQELPC